MAAKAKVIKDSFKKGCYRAVRAVADSEPAQPRSKGGFATEELARSWLDTFQHSRVELRQRDTTGDDTGADLPPSRVVELQQRDTTGDDTGTDLPPSRVARVPGCQNASGAGPRDRRHSYTLRLLPMERGVIEDPEVTCRLDPEAVQRQARLSRVLLRKGGKSKIHLQEQGPGTVCHTCGRVHRPADDELCREARDPLFGENVQMDDLQSLATQRQWRGDHSGDVDSDDNLDILTALLVLVDRLLSNKKTVQGARRVRLLHQADQSRQLSQVAFTLESQLDSMGEGNDELKAHCWRDLHRHVMRAPKRPLKEKRRHVRDPDVEQDARRHLGRRRRMVKFDEQGRKYRAKWVRRARRHKGRRAMQRGSLDKCVDALCRLKKRKQALELFKQKPWKSIIAKIDLLLPFIRARRPANDEETRCIVDRMERLCNERHVLPEETVTRDLMRYAGETWSTLQILVRQVRLNPQHLQLRLACVQRLRLALHHLPRDWPREELMTSEQRLLEQRSRKLGIWVVSCLSELLPDLYKIPAMPEPPDGPLNQLVQLMPKRIVCKAATKRVRNFVKKVFPSPKLMAPPELGSPSDRAALTTKAELASLANLLELFPSDVMLWRMLAAALVDSGSQRDYHLWHSTRTVVTLVWGREARARFWQEMFFTSPLPGHLHGRPLYVYRTLVLLCAYAPQGRALLPAFLKAIQGAAKSPQQCSLHVNLPWPEGLRARAKARVPRAVPHEVWHRSMLHALHLANTGSVADDPSGANVEHSNLLKLYDAIFAPA